MCRGAAVLAMLLMVPPAGSAQDASAWRDSALRLSAVLRDMRDSVSREQSKLPQVARGSGMVVSASPEILVAGAELLRDFDAGRRRWFGASLPSSLGFRIVLTAPDRRSRPPRYGDELFSLALAGLPDSSPESRVSVILADGFLNHRDAVVQELLFQYGRLMLATTGDALPRWLVSLPLMMRDTDRREQAMYALVTGVGPAQRGCIAGDPADCAYALGLRASGRADPGALYLPLLRADLLLAAIEYGGAEAWERLAMKTDADIEARLAAAAGLPIDSVIARWRRDLFELRPDRTPVRLRGVLTLLGWSAFAVLAALGVARWV